jgi:Tat protein translocase TatB subunit
VRPAPAAYAAGHDTRKGYDAMFGIGAQELVVIAVIALIVFGPERLPELAARLAKALRDVRRLSDELTGEFQRSLADDNHALPDQGPTAGTAVTPATPDTVGSALARGLRVETIPDEPILPTPEATGDSPHGDAPSGRAAPTGTTVAAARSGGDGDSDPANVPPGRPDPGPLPSPMSADGLGGLAAVPTRGQAGAGAHSTAEEVMPPRAGGLPSHETGDPHAAFRARRRRATYRRPRR